MSSRRITATGFGPSLSTRLMFEPVTSMRSLVCAVVICAATGSESVMLAPMAAARAVQSCFFLICFMNAPDLVDGTRTSGLMDRFYGARTIPRQLQNSNRLFHFVSFSQQVVTPLISTAFYAAKRPFTYRFQAFRDKILGLRK